MFLSHGTTLTVRTFRRLAIQKFKRQHRGQFFSWYGRTFHPEAVSKPRPSKFFNDNVVVAWTRGYSAGSHNCRALTSSVRTERKIIMNSSVWTKCSVKFSTSSKISIFKKYPCTCRQGLKRVETCVQRGVKRTKTWQRKSVQRAKNGEEVHLQRAQDLPCHVSPL